MDAYQTSEMITAVLTSWIGARAAERNWILGTIKQPPLPLTLSCHLPLPYGQILREVHLKGSLEKWFFKFPGAISADPNR